MPLCPLLFFNRRVKSHENVAAFDISLSDLLLKCRPLYSNQNGDGFTFLQFLTILLIDFIIWFFCFWFFFSFLGFCFKCLTSNLTITPPIIPLSLSLPTNKSSKAFSERTEGWWSQTCQKWKINEKVWCAIIIICMLFIGMTAFCFL